MQTLDKLLISGIAALIAAATSVAIAPAPAEAAFFHNYSVVYENTGTGFTGVLDAHLTQAVTGQPATGCTAPFMGSPVYESSWHGITHDGLDFDEIGVGHQCNDTYRYTYWGYQEGGTWHVIGYATGAVNGSSHYYQISRSWTGTEYDDFWIEDSVTKAHLRSNQRGVFESVGLESYSSTAHVIGYSTNSLQYQKNEGSFAIWSGRDLKIVDPSMCGTWTADTSFRSGENVVC
jgi:hypothetical protein